MNASEEFIRKVAPRFSGAKGTRQDEIIKGIAPVFIKVLGDYNIGSLLRVSHFMGQVTHECAGFRTTEEFASGRAYEGRKDLGNTHAGDGRRYKGRGLIQLTGRSNYRRIGQTLGMPLEDHPEIAGEPAVALTIACEYWKMRSINTAADSDDLIRVTRLVNGGVNGLEDRRQYYDKAKKILQRDYLRYLNEGTI